MATEVTCIVDTDGSQNPDYTSVAAAIAGELSGSPKAVTSPDLVAHDEQLTIICRASAGAADTSTVTINGFTTSEGNHIKIWTDPEESFRHAGIWPESGNIYKLICTGSTVIARDSYVKLIGLALESTGGGTVTVYTYNPGLEAAYNIMRSHQVQTYSGGCLGLISSSGPGNTVYNNVFIIRNKQGIGVGDSGTGDKVYNNTMVCTVYPNTARWVSAKSGASVKMLAINNLVHNCISGTGGYPLDPDSDYNATSCSYLRYAPNTNDRLNQSFSFVDESGGNYALKSDDTGAKDYGLGDPGSGLYADDIAGISRPQGTAWDIGAFECEVYEAVLQTPFMLQCGFSIDSVSLSVDLSYIPELNIEVPPRQFLVNISSRELDIEVPVRLFEIPVKKRPYNKG